MREVIKRDGSHVAFDESKIYQAILKAMKYGSGIINENVANKIAHEINLFPVLFQAVEHVIQVNT